MSAELTAGGIELNLRVHVDAEQIMSWPPEVTAAFFRGVSQILAAQHAGADLKAALATKADLDRLIDQVRAAIVAQGIEDNRADRLADLVDDYLKVDGGPGSDCYDAARSMEARAALAKAVHFATEPQA